MRTAEPVPVLSSRRPEAAASAGGHAPTAPVMGPVIVWETDPGRELYAERSRHLAGLLMPEAPAWEDLPEQVRNRWRGYAGAPG